MSYALREIAKKFSSDISWLKVNSSIRLILGSIKLKSKVLSSSRKHPKRSVEKISHLQFNWISIRWYTSMKIIVVTRRWLNHYLINKLIRVSCIMILSVGELLPPYIVPNIFLKFSFNQTNLNTRKFGCCSGADRQSGHDWKWVILPLEGWRCPRFWLPCYRLR